MGDRAFVSASRFVEISSSRRKTGRSWANTSVFTSWIVKWNLKLVEVFCSRFAIVRMVWRRWRASPIPPKRNASVSPRRLYCSTNVSSIEFAWSCPTL